MTEHDPLAFTYKNTKRLIQMVQERHCLWNRQTLDYKDRLARDRAWSEIFVDLEPGYKTGDATMRHEIGSSITKKWYNIRDSYVKSLKPDYLGRRNRPYVHADLLRFLDDGYMEKVHISRFKRNNRAEKEVQEEAQEEETEDYEAEEFETEAWEQKVLVNLEEEEPSAKRPRLEYSPENSLKENTKIKDEEDIISVLSNLIKKEEDEDRAFFKSITPSVKKLSEDSKFVFRIEVLKLIKGLRDKDKKNIEKVEKGSNIGSESE